MTSESNKYLAMDPTDVENSSREILHPSIISKGTTDPVYVADTPTNGADPLIPDYEEKYSLKKLKYPDCAEAAIKAIADLVIMTGIEGGKKIDTQTALINEYIFGKIENLSIKGIPRVHSEFQLMNILTEFICDAQRAPAIRNAIILSLFPCTSPRSDYLGNLICFSICLPHTEILDAAGIWMQQVGSTSDCAQKLAIHIVDYFCEIAPSLMADLIGMAELVPYFSANLLTAIAEVFKDKDPPDQMLHLVDTWLKNNPNILTASLTNDPALPPGGIPMTPITPITGLFRWCILCPTRQESCYYDQSNVALSKRFMLYSAIYNKLLAAIYSLKDSQSNKNAISACDLEQIMYIMRDCLQSRLPNISKTSYDLAIERLSEALRVTSMANCIYGNKQKLFNLMKPLEEIRSNYIQS